MLCISIIKSCKKNILLKYTSIQKKSSTFAQL